MCGIAGLFDISGRARDSDPAVTARRMADAISHRGPDGDGAWGDSRAGIGFGHRRLAIVELSPKGAQPMHSADGRYVITYNGEIYNFQELRAELQKLGHAFNGGSDTEVMLTAFIQWGIRDAVSRFVGMFAFAVYDGKEREMHLVRDRLGVKPLYWTLMNGFLLFGSELRALMAHSAFRKDIDRDAIASTVRYSYIPAPRTAFRDVSKLPAGSILSIKTASEPKISSYWRVCEVVCAPKAVGIGFDEAAGQVEALMRDSVRRRMIADVPLGAFLSGGTDSSAVVAMMQSVSNRPVRTFTIGFDRAAYDEAVYAKEIARHLGTEHTEVTLAPRDVLDLVGSVADWFDEPFADSSQLPTYLVSRVTRKHVTVALSGDGGDELFAGYPKYSWLDTIWNSLGGLPRPVRAVIGSVPLALPESILEHAARMILDPGRAERIGEKIRRLAAALSAADSDHAAAALASVGYDDTGLITGIQHAPALSPLEGIAGCLPDLISRMQANDMATYLPDDILVKVDRCSMAVALEAREPLLDHRLVELIWSLPADIRRGDGRPKALLRAILEKHIPSTMIDRPKRGFSVPLHEWLTGPLRNWAEALLSTERLSANGIFDANRVRSLWQKHLDGSRRNASGLWNILMVQAWAERWLRI